MQIGSIELRPMQIEAVNKFRNVEAVLVGDDTGGGKTVTSIALVWQIWESGESGPVLIVTKSFDVWVEHLKRMDIHEDYIHVINPRKRSEFIEELSLAYSLGMNDFYIMHWDALPLQDIQEILPKIKWLCIIADEAHKAKNRKAQRTKALKKLSTKYKIAATATPGDNIAPDIWSLLNWLYPKKYTSYWRWVRYYIECTEHWKGYTIYGGPIKERIPEFQAEIEPFYIGRTLSEIDSSVPEMVYSSVEVDMHPKQVESYNEILQWQMAYLGDDLLVVGTQLEASMRMHQLANAYGRLEVRYRFKEIETPSGKERVRVPRYSVRLEEPSTKLDLLIQMLSEGHTQTVAESGFEKVIILQPDEPIVIFSTYLDMVAMACRRMDELDITYVECTGRSKLSADQAARVFADGNVRVFIGTPETAGESIDLTRARVMIYIDVHWSPRVKKQCDGRIRRIGQTRVPWCIDIKARNTVDYVKLDRVRTKQQWQDAMFGRDK